MAYREKISALFGLILASSGTVYAGEIAQRIIIAPQCLVQKTHHTFETLATSHSLVLLRTDIAGVDALANAKIHTGALCGGFMDVTPSWQSASLRAENTAPQFLIANSVNKPTPDASYDIHYPTQVNQLMNTINPQAMWTNLTKLTSYTDRNSRSEEGANVAAWIKDQMEEMAKKTGHDDVTVYYVQTGSGYKQRSVVAKLGKGDDAGIVIGAHMDTLASWGEAKPGADDDGSGSVTVMETARTLLASGMQFKKPVYFIWYAAEEEGLVGSRAVVNEFVKNKIAVNAVIHFDMTGYAYKNESTMWLMDDYTNKDLTSYMEKLITTYVKKPVRHSRCGYACSDHASWNKAGFPATIPAEAAYENTNPNLHTSNDTMNNLSLDHMTDYAKLAVAAAVELAEPVNK